MAKIGFVGKEDHYAHFQIDKIPCLTARARSHKTIGEVLIGLVQLKPLGTFMAMDISN